MTQQSTLMLSAKYEKHIDTEQYVNKKNDTRDKSDKNKKFLLQCNQSVQNKHWQKVE